MKKNKNLFKWIARSIYFLLLLFGLSRWVYAESRQFALYVGQSEVLEFDEPVKRVAISDPDVVNANVISPHQILLDGKKQGVTSLVVWPATDAYKYKKYRLKVCEEATGEQVMLHVRFLEIKKSAMKTFGSDFLIKAMQVKSQTVDIGSYAGKVTTPSDPLILSNTADLFFSIPTKNISTVIKALQENNLVTVLASPNLSALSGEQATFLAGGEFPIPIVSGSLGMQTVSIQYKEYGVKLMFVPTVLDTGTVNIKVAAEVSHLDFENGVILSGYSIPSLEMRKLETTVELKQDQYLILGGLLSNNVAETVSKIPILGHIPVLGALFSSKNFQNKESELLITLNPTIVRGMSEADLPALELEEDK